MRTPQFAFSAVVVASTLFHPLSAQSPAASSTKTIGFTGGVAMTYGNLTGGDFDGTKAGAGFDVNAGITRGTWQVGLGYDRTNHGHEDSAGDFVVSNLYLEPRYNFTAASHRLTPYVVARVGRAMASFDESYGGTSDAHGWIYGLGAGVLWPLAHAVQADGAAHFARVSHDYGSGDYSDSEKGNLISMRVGVRVFK